MKKIKLKPRLKIDRLGHKYALDISKFHEKTNIKIDFNNLNKDFYEDIESNDIEIKKEKNLLNKIKNISIKEFIYANKSIPDLWKNKINYQKDMMNIITKDDNLLSYIGSQQIKYNYIKKLPKIKNILNKIKENNNDIKNNEIINDSRSSYEKKSIKYKNKKELNNDDIKILLDDYKNIYPIKKKLNDLIITSQENYKKFENELLITTDKNNNSNSTDLNLETFPHIKKINSLKNKRVFGHNIFIIDSLKQNTLKKNKSSFFKNNNNNNNKVGEYIKSINYYGPHFSFCPSCRKKNLSFYNNMGHKQCIELINHIKNFRKKNNFNNINNINHISLKKSVSDFPQLNLFSAKDNETSESEENTYKVKF